MSKKVSPTLKRLLGKLADNAKMAAELNRQIQEECNKLGIDTDSQKFTDAFSYVEGDYDISPIIEYIESEGE